MKKLLVLFALVIVTACQNSKEEAAKNRPKNYALLFFDKTQSVNLSVPFVKNKYFGALSTLIDQNIEQAGDKIDIYYIHENTAKAKVLTMVAKTIKESTEGLNATDLEAANTNYELSIKKERRLMLQMAMQKMLEQNTGASNTETNITASIPLISAATESGSEVKVYYFSDMVESLKTGRDFHKMAPISVNQAENWAKDDAEKMKSYSIANVKIAIILPFDPMSSSTENNPNVSDYWAKLFDLLGAQKMEEL